MSVTTSSPRGSLPPEGVHGGGGSEVDGVGAPEKDSSSAPLAVAQVGCS